VSIRGDVADAIAAALAAEFPRVQVYATPEDLTTVPAVVLVPADTWAEPATMGKAGQAGAWRWAWDVQLVASRTDPASALDTMEGLLFAITQGVGTLGGAVRSLDGPDTADVNGIPVLVAECRVELHTTRRA